MLLDLSLSLLLICPPAQWHMLRYLLRYLRNTNMHQSMCCCAGWMDVFNVVTVNRQTCDFVTCGIVNVGFSDCCIELVLNNCECGI